MQPALRVCTIACVMGLTACEGETIEQVFPILVVEPEIVDFGVGIVGGENPGTLVIRNEGPGALEIQALQIETSPDIFSLDLTTDSPLDRRFASAQETTLQLRFTPEAAKVMYEGTLVITSNDPERSPLTVPLRGEGGIRNIEVDPRTIDFSIVDEGTTVRRDVEIRNTGLDPLQVTLSWTSTSVDLGPEELPTESIVVGPNASTTVTLVYAPTDYGADAGTLVIASNDEDEPSIEVEVQGRANLAPQAIAWLCPTDVGVIGCAMENRRKSSTVPFLGFLGLDGSDSMDPEGVAFDSVRWQVVETPDDVPAPLVLPDTMTGGLTGQVQVQAPGRYTLRLVVTDDRGLESFDSPEARVEIRPRDLEVYLRWDVATDLDLHMVRPGGTVGDYGTGRVGTSLGTDCSSFNRGPNWGDPSTSIDDPSLDRDVVTDTGPEVISLDFPEDGGAYQIFAHYCDSRNVNANANAWVEIYARGTLVDRIPMDDGRRRLLPTQLWQAATIVWDAQAETASVEPSDAPILLRPDLCTID